MNDEVTCETPIAPEFALPPRRLDSSSFRLNELFAALAKAQGKIKGATKDVANPFFKSKYADLASVWDACRDALSENGLSVIQATEAGNADTVTVYTTLGHSSGQYITSGLTMKPVKADPQGIGSTITYARRYALAAMVGVAPEDDDGNAATGRKGTEPTNTGYEPPRTVNGKPSKDMNKATDQQWLVVNDLLKQTGTSLETVMSYYKEKNPKIKGVNDLTFEQVEDIRVRLHGKLNLQKARGKRVVDKKTGEILDEGRMPSDHDEDIDQ